MSRSRFILLLLAVLALAQPARAGEFVPEPDEYAAAVVLQASTGKVLYAFKPDKPHVAASLTKLGAALAAVASKPNWDRVVALSKYDEVGGGRLRVASGATLTIRDLFYSALTASANNAAMALGHVTAPSMKTFVSRMNSAVKTAGATHTALVEPSGMDPKNTTTAKDVAMIARTAFRDPLIRAASTAGTYEFRIRNTGEVKLIKNTSETFLADPEVWMMGGKTGYLPESKYNLVSQLRPVVAGSPDSKYEVIVAVLGSPSKEASFKSVKRLASWAWANPSLFKRAPPEFPLTRELDPGERHNQVKTVQAWLAEDPELYPEGLITGYYGPMTRAAVQRFQLREGIVRSARDLGYGRVGPATRARLLEVFASDPS